MFKIVHFVKIILNKDVCVAKKLVFVILIQVFVTIVVHICVKNAKPKCATFVDMNEKIESYHFIYYKIFLNSFMSHFNE